jgi:hypothetical protein
MQSSAACVLSTLTLTLLGAALAPQQIRASSSGLNNIPTADTAPNLTLVVQEYSTFGSQRGPDHIAGFKFGVDPWEKTRWRHRFEWGIDSHFAPSDAGPAVLQVKYATQPGPRWPALSVGVANIAATTNDRTRTGQPFWYGVLSQDLKYLRLHGGYGLQRGDNNTAILGIDKTVKLFRRDLMLRADAIQIDRRRNWAPSAGGLYAICKYFVIESWITQPAHGHPRSFTIKLDSLSRYDVEQSPISPHLL